MANLFYNPNAQEGATILIDQAEANHLIKVLRKKEGDQIEITDGKGGLFTAALHIGKREVIAIIQHEKIIPPANISLEIAIAPTKNNERLEWFIEKAVEIGVSRISLIQCQHSERPHLKLDRLERVAISAMKQSLKYYLPEIHVMIPFEDWLASTSAVPRYIAHCRPLPDRALLKSIMISGKSAVIAIGPEGDFSQAEIEMALSMGFLGVSLGHSRLRTETAALVAVHTFDLINQ